VLKNSAKLFRTITTVRTFHCLSAHSANSIQELFKNVNYYCQEYFDFSLPSVLWAKRVAKFEVKFE